MSRLPHRVAIRDLTAGQDACLAQDVLGHPCQAGKALAHNAAYALRNLELLDLAPVPPTVLAKHITPLDQDAQDLLHEEWVSIGATVDQPRELFADLLLPQQSLNQAVRVALIQPAHVDALYQALPLHVTEHPLQGMLAVDVHVTKIPQQEDTVGAGVPCQVLEQIKAGGVRPVQIIEEKCHRAIRNGGVQERAHSPEQPLLVFLAGRVRNGQPKAGKETGKIALERKEQMARRGVKSPDFADALALAYYHVPQRRLWAG